MCGTNLDTVRDGAPNLYTLYIQTQCLLVKYWQEAAGFYSYWAARGTVTPLIRDTSQWLTSRHGSTVEKPYNKGGGGYAVTLSVISETACYQVG